MLVMHILIEFVEIVIVDCDVKIAPMFLCPFCCEAHSDFLQITFMKVMHASQPGYKLKLLSSFFPDAVYPQVEKVSSVATFFPPVFLGRVLGCCYDEQVPTV